MAFEDPLWIDGLAYSGSEPRHADAMLLAANGVAAGSAGGVRPGDPGLKASITGMTVTVPAGVAAVPFAGQGVYRAYTGSSTNLTVPTAHASLQRLDLVYLRVWDGAVDASGLFKADLVYLAGTPGSGTLPSPTGTVIWIPLAQVTVPAASTTPSITDLRPAAVAPGGMPPVPSSGLATGGLYTGASRFNLVRGCPEYWTGTAWAAQGDWTTYTPTWTAQTTNPVIGNGSLTGRYTVIGKTCVVKMELQTGTTTTYGSGVYFWALPFTSSLAGTAAAVGAGHGISPTARWDLGVLVTSNSGVLQITSPSASNNVAHVFLSSTQALSTPPWASGIIVRADITYEIA